MKKTKIKIPIKKKSIPLRGEERWGCRNQGQGQRKREKWRGRKYGERQEPYLKGKCIEGSENLKSRVARFTSLD